MTRERKMFGLGHQPIVAAGLLALLLTIQSCSPSLSPLYRDFVNDDISEEDLHGRMSRAIEAAGWTLTESPAPSVLTTERRKTASYGLYNVQVWIDVSPVNQKHVRVFFHPYRYFLTGGRSKLAFLPPGLARRLVRPLQESFEAEGLRLVGTPVRRDREMTTG